MALVGLWAASMEDGRGRRFRVTLPKHERVVVEVLSSSNPIRVRVADHEIEFAISDSGSHSESNSNSPIVTPRHADVETPMTLVARRKSGFDVGLWDRVLDVKCEAEGNAVHE